jgi:alpha-D-ribose 1-methylphosphonate 5-triphosphate diphosphatase
MTAPAFANHAARCAVHTGIELFIEGGRVLLDDGFATASINVRAATGTICGIGKDFGADRRVDAGGLLVLPGIVDLHGDAFERQMMPRPGVEFPIDVALIDTDRQVVANGITTVFHGVTWSWEPGLRGAKNARAILEAVERLRPRLAADTRFHLRHETFNLDAEEEIVAWLSRRRIDVLAFNDHMSLTIEATGRPEKIAQMVKRSGLTRHEFDSLLERVKRRGDEVLASIERLARAARAGGVPLLSHDDTSPERRRWFRALGCRTAEFPTNIETAEEAPLPAAMTSCSAPPTSCAAAAIRAGSRPPTWWRAACARF